MHSGPPGVFHDWFIQQSYTNRVGVYSSWPTRKFLYQVPQNESPSGFRILYKLPKFYDPSERSSQLLN